MPYKTRSVKRIIRYSVKQHKLSYLPQLWFCQNAQLSPTSVWRGVRHDSPTVLPTSTAEQAEPQVGPLCCLLPFDLNSHIPTHIAASVSTPGANAAAPVLPSCPWVCKVPWTLRDSTAPHIQPVGAFTADHARALCYRACSTVTPGSLSLALAVLLGAPASQLGLGRGPAGTACSAAQSCEASAARRDAAELERLTSLSRPAVPAGAGSSASIAAPARGPGPARTAPMVGSACRSICRSSCSSHWRARRPVGHGLVAAALHCGAQSAAEHGPASLSRGNAQHVYLRQPTAPPSSERQALRAGCVPASA